MNHKAYIREPRNANTAIVFIHGIMGSPDHFEDFLSRVPQTWAVYNVLLDGHGRTLADFAASSMKRWKAQTATLLDQLRALYGTIFLVGHSMGTLLALDAAISDPTNIKELFLLAVPLKIHLRPLAFRNSVKVVFDRVSEGDPVALAAKRACSVAPDRHLWKYLPCLPRYMELLCESHRIGERLPALSVPNRVWMSKKDELVRPASAKAMQSCSTARVRWLPSSSHYYYTEADRELFLADFSAMCTQTPVGLRADGKCDRIKAEEEGSDRR